MSSVIVYHSGYGCETGCCGHRVELDGRSTHEWEHPDDDETPLEFAKRLVAKCYGEEHVADLDWENCEIVSYKDCG